MAIHESSINYKNLIKDLVQMYPDDVAHVIVSELIANSLDSQADSIEVDIDPAKRFISVSDNGKGMDKSQFKQYHDFAAELKKKGNGIGFAGLGAKISFHIAEKVKTETRSETFSGGSDWYFNSQEKLQWEDIKPENISIQKTGTRVKVYFTRFPYNSEEEVLEIIQRNYLPLFDKNFLDTYGKMKTYPYSEKTKFIINGKIIQPYITEEKYSLNSTKNIFPVNNRGKKIGFGFVGLADNEYPISERFSGIILCTYGKVIKSDFLGQHTAQYGSKILGIVEMPDLINFLNTAKSDFTRPRGKVRSFEKLLDSIRQEFKKWLSSIGVSDIGKNEDSTEMAKLEREIRKIIPDIPELAEFFGFSKGRALTQSNKGEIDGHSSPGTEVTYSTNSGERKTSKAIAPLTPGNKEGEAIAEDGKQKAAPISRKTKTGPQIGFSSRPDQTELAWIEGNQIIINSGHSAYKKANTNPASRTLHNLFSIAGAIQKLILADENRKLDFMFVDKMMLAWGNKN